MDDEAAMVPSGRLMHALRTPLHQLDGHGALLLAGASGRLDDQARSAILAMHGATRMLLRTVDLVEAVAASPPAAGTSPTWQPLASAWDRAAAPHGWTAVDGEGGHWPTLAWSDALAALAVAALDERAARTLELVADGSGRLSLRASPFDAGGADAALATWLLDAMADRGRVGLEYSGDGEIVLALGPWVRGPSRRCWQR